MNEAHLGTARAAPVAEESGAAAEGRGPSLLRAWLYLVWLSLQRQARARQMVWIALALLVLAVGVVYVREKQGKWGMHYLPHPRWGGPPTGYAVDKGQVWLAAFHRDPCAQAIEQAGFGACRAMLDPKARTVKPDGTPGPVLAASGFHLFCRWAVFVVFLPFLLPVWSLSFATEAIGGDRESNSLIWLLTRPLPRPAIYLAKFVALLPWTLGFNVGGFALICLAAGPSGLRALGLFWPTVLWSTLTFSALFLLMGTYFRRPAVVAILYSFCLEALLGGMPGYLKRVSVNFYARSLMFDVAQSYGIQPEAPDVYLPVGGTTAVIVLVGGAALLLAAGMAVFAHTEYQEMV